MKKPIFIILILLVAFLPACAGASPAQVKSEPTQPAVETAEVVTESVPTAQPVVEATATQEPTPTQEKVALDTSYENAVSVPLQLLVGTLKLDGSDLALSKEQASTLLTLWSDFKTLSQSMAPVLGAPGQAGQSVATAQPESASTAMQDKINEMVEKISAVMTADQLHAIGEMKITQETATALMTELGVTMGGGAPGNGAAGQSPQGSGGAGGNPPAGDPGGNSGGGGAGAPPAGGGAGGAGGPPSGGGQMTPPQGGSESLASGMIPPPMVNALLEKLGAISGIEVAIETMQPGQGPQGTPGANGAGGPGGPGGPGGSASAPTDYAAAYKQSGGTETKSGQTYTASDTDQSGIFVTNAGTLNLSNSTINTSGNTSSQDSSSFYGLNAAVLAFNDGVINLSESAINTTGSGANGAFAVGTGSTVNLSKVSITASGDGGHGVMATLGGAVTLTDVNIHTAGKNSAPLATDRGSGTIKFTGGIVTASGSDSPPIYSTGTIEVTNGTLSTTGAEAAVIEGGNTIILTDSDLSSSLEGKWGVMIYQSMSGDAEGTRGTFTMTGGSLGYSSTSGPLFYVTNSTGVITLKGVTVTVASGTLVKAAAGNWGASGSNGGTVNLTADGQTLAGNMIADALSSISVDLKNSSPLSGAINADRQAKAANLTLDAASTWNVTADSYLTCLVDTDGISGTTVANITGNGFTVYYDANACSALGGNSYTLNGGGYLKPAN